ncbi:lipopolysaccharide biosynthesis protein [Ureibacillus sp. MALMAid1270]|uniref:lipopolysaccharide biosynthesis protein n=1 Tax=Ureibacillus sp. MALMAid1270 TaxID=3411629 RepID=UPI003BA44787
MNNGLLKLGLRNIVYVVTSQIIAYVLSLLTSFVLPNFLGVTHFAYWQIYLFYSSYFAVLGLGFGDGIYLKYGKYDYNELPKPLLHTAYKIYTIMLILFVTLLNILISFEADPMMQFAYRFASFTIFILGCNSVFIMIYQITNRMKLYSFTTIIDKITMITAISLLFLFDFKYFQIVVALDVISKIIVLLINIYNCKEIIFTKGVSLVEGFREFKENIKIGINLLLANLVGMLLIGLGRIIIEHTKSIEEYGLYSFAITSTNLALMFITAISLVLYPIIARMTDTQKITSFKRLNSMTSVLIFSMMLVYFPVRWLIENIMTEYIPTLDYLFILFPIVVAQSKMQIVNNTFYKVLRKEKAMLLANLSSIAVFLVIGIPLFIIFDSIEVIAVSTLLTLLWRCYSSEIFLKKKMGGMSNLNIIEELLIIASFILITSILNGVLSFIIYLIVLAVYIVLKRNDIILFINEIKNLKNKREV